jgi:hypothetical protein
MKRRLLNIAAAHIRDEVPYNDYKQVAASAFLDIYMKFTGEKLTDRQEINFHRKCGLWSGKVH